METVSSESDALTKMKRLQSIMRDVVDCQQQRISISTGLE